MPPDRHQPSELIGVPADQLTPGVRWQRRGAFADDPDVSKLYRELRERGQIELPGISAAHNQLALALSRRAAEDGLAASARYLHDPQHALRVALTGPLEARDFDLAPVYEEAVRLYRAALNGCTEWRHSEIGKNCPGPALIETDFDSLLCAEIERLAAADGIGAEVLYDEFNLYVVLGPSSEQPPTAGALGAPNSGAADSGSAE